MQLAALCAAIAALRGDQKVTLVGCSYVATLEPWRPFQRVQPDQRHEVRQSGEDSRSECRVTYWVAPVLVFISVYIEYIQK